MSKKDGLPNKKRGRKPGVPRKRKVGVGLSTLKKCANCKLVKPVEQFCIRSGGTHYQSRCKHCEAERLVLAHRRLRFAGMPTDRLVVEVLKAEKTAELAREIIRKRTEGE